MADLEIIVETTKTSMADIRSELDAALAEEFPGGMLKRSWQDDVLQLSGPGAHGHISYHEGRLMGEAHLGPPASMMRGTIEKKISAAMRRAAG